MSNEETTSISDTKTMAEDEDKTKSLYIFGRNVAEIPCFRSSFLYGIGGGFVGGAVSFLATSRTALSTNIGFATFFCGTIFYWVSCRYEWSKKRFQYQQLQMAMKKQALYEGTAVENEIEKKTESC
ncbi:unnamed protein product [Hermetia illucens]|uniref:Cytochrome c oxidase assembly protein COX20, mitochondrial n=1 Tax=Hermetia illucens TaxID=343691 RepID=A0A7R8UDN8_HERIL|nr:cytochrome c oxidase assembly protein COX20, mitochondrial [Hermetia illucens]XP_037903953.1 cytochrome c oxidase assembly protein COX20, mitochondrial [Hermetia illucens]XP_037903954.1 cytochrome c oxidase assembly protein COX20, mitochondrial [Hermetia illucens]CAD7078868.1 unnamed protein product [Hermetia illucens]